MSRAVSLKWLDRDLLTRRDIEKLFGVSKMRAAQLMTAFGAGRTGYLLTLPRAELLRQFRRHRKRAAFRQEEMRHEKVVTEIRRARLTGIRVAVPVEALDARLSGLPAGVTGESDRLEVRFGGAQGAVGRLFALAQALVNDYERFEALVGGGAAGGGEEVTGTSEEVALVGRVEALRPAAAERGGLRLPRLIVSTLGRRRWGSFWEPIIDARLADGSRVAICGSPAAPTAAITIRRFGGRAFTIDELTESGSLPAVVVQEARAVLGRERNLLISGGTGSGKTTLLNALVSLLPADGRVISIEDTLELGLRRANCRAARSSSSASPTDTTSRRSR